MYMNISIRFVNIVISHQVSSAFTSFTAYLVGWSFPILLRLASLLVFLILLGGDVHKNPGPLNICHWNFGGLTTDSYSKSYPKPSSASTTLTLLSKGKQILTLKLMKKNLILMGIFFSTVIILMIHVGVVLVYKASQLFPVCIHICCVDVCIHTGADLGKKLRGDLYAGLPQ